jgi:adenylosuccinate lyase
MKANLEATNGQVMAEAVMMALAAKGLGRQEAHQLIRDAAQIARTKGTLLRDALLAEPRVSKLLSAKELDATMDPTSYLGQSASIVDSTLKRVR